MKTDRQITGRMGEDEACRYLERHGHTILERNWRSGHLEIDIISLSGDGLHIVEVKSRTAPAMAAPEANVGTAKQKKLASAAKAYLHSPEKKQLPWNLEIFFDIVTVLVDGPDFVVDYYPHAFIPTYV